MSYKRTKIMFLISVMLGLFLQLSLIYSPNIVGDLSYIYLLLLLIISQILVLVFWYFDYKKYYANKMLIFPDDLLSFVGYACYFVCKNNAIKSNSTKEIVLWIGVIIVFVSFFVIMKERNKKLVNLKIVKYLIDLKFIKTKYSRILFLLHKTLN